MSTDNMKEKLSSIRQEFHQCAEEGWMEFRTTIKIIEYLKVMGYDIYYGRQIHSNPMGMPGKEEMDTYRNKCMSMKIGNNDSYSDIFEGYTGALAVLDTGIPGPVVAFRFDIDGIKSKNGVAHLCGHDGHIAIGLVFAKTIMDMKNKLRGKIKLIFQPAEEGVRGAKSIVESGALEDVDYFFGGHLGIIDDDMAIGVRAHNMLATDKINITFTGKAAHASLAPEKGRNALLAAASCILGLHSQIQFGSGMARLNVGVLHGGRGKNIIADKAVIELESRGETNEINDRILEIINNVVKGTAIAFGVQEEIQVVGEAAAYNYQKDEFSEKIIGILKELRIKILSDFDFGASEDVTHMLSAVENHGGKGLFFLFPSHLKAPHHSPDFDFQEESMFIAHSCYRKVLESVMKGDI